MFVVLGGSIAHVVELGQAAQRLVAARRRGRGGDRQDQVYVFDRGEHPMIVFDRNGDFLAQWAMACSSGRRPPCRPHDNRRLHR